MDVAAADLARSLLAAGLPRRWAHVQAVADRARELSRVLEPDERELLVASAWLHDIGYSAEVSTTGMHALDGALWLVAHGYDRRLAALVAYHSCALFEAQERGLAEQLTEGFVQEQSPTADALWLADMTTGPDGQPLTVKERLAEIHDRYGAGHVVSRQWIAAEPTLMEAVGRMERLLQDHPM